MEILKTSTDWARAEIFSSAFFIAFGIGFLVMSLGFWHLGKTELARAYIIPLMVAGILLSIIGAGLVYANKTRTSEFAEAHAIDPAAFVQSELERVDSTLNEYQIVVFKAVPAIIVLSALLIVFAEAPTWRAISITTMAMLVVILLIDGTAHSRIAAYKDKLVEAERSLKSSS